MTKLSLRGKPLSGSSARCWTILDLIIFPLFTIILLIHSILQVEPMTICLIFFFVMYIILCSIFLRTADKACFQTHILAHGKNIASFLGLICASSLAYQSYYYSKVHVKSAYLFYFLFAYIALGLYCLVNWLVSFMMLGFSDQDFEVGSWRYIDHGREVYAAGRSFSCEDGEIRRVKVTKARSGTGMSSEMNSFISKNETYDLGGKHSGNSSGLQMGLGESLGRLKQEPGKMGQRVTVEGSVDHDRMRTYQNNEIKGSVCVWG